MADVRSADEQTLADARRIIADGGLVVIPTDTVYGIVCDPCNAAAIARIYVAKHRSADKALQVIMPDLLVLPKLGLTLPTPLDALAHRFLPGAFSPIAVAAADSALLTVRVDDSGARAGHSRSRFRGESARAACDRPGCGIEREPLRQRKRSDRR